MAGMGGTEIDSETERQPNKYIRLATDNRKGFRSALVCVVSDVIVAFYSSSAAREREIGSKLIDTPQSGLVAIGILLQ
ncbi:hypothetical protein KOR34_35360 [Posidoniimonas corsicana]|uniref:Uncharacterized protein n=1 Tax=Posidoniimonas corsicana TaxID=1938618 RepID=A0A5C5V6X1_9BACT|nr:hypothetical protein KOR34_35360 [Posidoniimonas corsicana]